jgi:hypothetical protein
MIKIAAINQNKNNFIFKGRVIYREIWNRNNVGGERYWSEWVYDDEGRTVTVIEGGKYAEKWYLNGWGEAVKKVDGEGNERGWRYIYVNYSHHLPPHPASSYRKVGYNCRIRNHRMAAVLITVKGNGTGVFTRPCGYLN